MEQSFTINQCIRLLYGELTPDEGIMLRSLIRDTPKLQGQFQELLEAKSLLEGCSLAPSGQSVDTVLKYSRKNSLQITI